VGVAGAVQAFYERYPYPPPLDDLDSYRQRWRDPQRRRADYHLLWPTRKYDESLSILIAGCGTSQAAKYAIRCPSAQVIGIDFSTTSVQHTAALKRKYGLGNLEVRQLAVERAADLGASFDQVVCTGVLHHLEDPDAGLRALRGVLKPNGAMHLMVYAPYGRNGIYMLQEFCRRVGFRASDGDIEDLAAALRALPAGHPLTRLLRESPDFQTESALADALLHPRDRAYSVPQLFEFLRANHLTFGRWLRQAPYSLRLGLMSRLPHSLRTGRISVEDQYAAAELLRGTMTRHSLVAYQDDDPCSPRITFSGDEWLGYVPIRMPDTLCVQERLPPEIAAILINRAHTYNDICLPIRTHEKRLLESIDGTRAIGEILGSRSDLDGPRAFFERMWWHDQIVIDASAATGLPAQPG
jgi:SAM-dependent methyltransferase